VLNDAFARGARLFDAGAFFAAHEAWEELWRVESDEARGRFLQGLIQIAAAFHKLVVVGSVEAAQRLLTKGLAKLDECPSQVAAANLFAFQQSTRAYALALARGSFDRSDIPTMFARGVNAVE
jgi:hypothetical protein